MRMPSDGVPSSSLPGVAFTALAGGCVAVGAASLTDAAGGWHDVLTVIYRSGTAACRGQTTIPGWGNDLVLVCTVAALVLLASTGLAMAHVRRWGQVTSWFAVLPILLLWIDTYAASGAPAGDCDAIGMGGAASVAIVRAGWLFFAAMALCFLSATWLGSKTDWRGLMTAE